MTKTNISWNITKDTLSIMVGTTFYSVRRAEAHYDNVKEALRDKDEERLIQLLDKPKAIVAYLGGAGTVKVKDGKVIYKGTELHNTLTRRILERISEQLDAQPLVNFLEKLMQNPSKRSVDTFYSFCEKHNFVIDESGDCILYKGCYKNDDGEVWDAHTRNTVKNDVGCIPERDRNTIDDDPSNICAASGLHVSSKQFADGYGNTTMLIKLNPRDVVSVANQDSAEKIRVCRYEVVAEVTRD